MYVTIADVFEQTVSRYPHQEALYDVQKQLRWSYAEWNSLVNRLANAFAEAGVRKGDRVSAFLYNGSEFVTTMFACAKIGAVFNPINFRLKADELTYIIQDAAPKIVIFEQALEPVVTQAASLHPHVRYWTIDPGGPDYAERYHDKLNAGRDVRPPRDVTEDDLYAVMYTSGTTGRPKGVLHRHRELIEQSMAMIGVMHYTAKSRGLIVNPLYHCGELHSGFFARVHAGGSSVVMRHFKARQALDLMREERITTMVAVPTIWKMLLQEMTLHDDVGTMEVGMYGGEAMSAEHIRSCLSRFGAKLVQAYGMTEMGPTVALLSFSPGDRHFAKAGSAGTSVLNHEIRVVRLREQLPSDPDDVLPAGEVGEIVVRGSCVMAGYHNHEAATREALYRGWYHTGDLGLLDADGCLWVVDRKNNMIVSGGENIYPREVEDALSEHPGVKEVAVVGTPDPKWGETVVAFVVKRQEEVSDADLDECCRLKLANYKRPRKYLFVDELPRNGSGKVLHRVLKEMANNEFGIQTIQGR